MRKLETIEDFRRIAKALKNPDSLPQQYVAKNWHPNFGYCTVCRAVTECESHGDKGGGWVECKKCLQVWYGWSSGDFYLKYISEMPATQEVVDKLIKLLPREKEKEKLAELLREFIERQKRMVGEYKKQYRNARISMERGHKLLATLR